MCAVSAWSPQYLEKTESEPNDSSPLLQEILFQEIFYTSSTGRSLSRQRHESILLTLWYSITKNLPIPNMLRLKSGEYPQNGNSYSVASKEEMKELDDVRGEGKA